MILVCNHGISLGFGRTWCFIVQERQGAYFAAALEELSVASATHAEGRWHGESGPDHHAWVLWF